MLVKLWHIILESNTLNFLVFIAIFALIFKKIKLSDKLSCLRQKTEKVVNESKDAKQTSEQSLLKAKNQIEKVEEDVTKIIDNASNTAKSVSENIVLSANERIGIINNNAKKVIDNDIYKAKKSLFDATIQEALTQTNENIKNRLKTDENLHQKYIDEAITELEGMNL